MMKEEVSFYTYIGITHNKSKINNNNNSKNWGNKPKFGATQQ